MSRSLQSVVLAAALAAVAACGEARAPYAPPAEDAVPPLSWAPDAASREAYVAQLQSLGVDRYLDAIAPVSTATVGDWDAHHYDEAAGAVCIDGSDYIVSVRPATRPSNDVVLYLQGGGACWDYSTCFGAPMAKQRANVPGSHPTGFLDRDELANPLRDWHVVFASYCDGSVFSGDSTVRYEGRTTHHWGLRNLSAAVTVMRQRYPRPARILIAGSSAGGFGTLMAGGVVRAAYPDEPLMVLNDSGPGLENPALRDDMGRSIRRQWNFRQFMPDDCTACDDQLFNLVDYVLRRDPDVRVGLFSYRDDAVIGSLFLRLYGDYWPLLEQTTDPIHQRHPDRFQRFFVEGIDHTIMGTNQYAAQWPHGQTFAAWLGAMVDGDAEHWVDWP